MIEFEDLQEILAEGFFSGNLEIAGILIFAAVLLIIFALTRKVTQALIIALPITLVFSMMGMLTTDFMILLIIITVLGLAYKTKDSWGS